MDHSEILERAKALGKQLADNPRVKAYLQAQEGLQHSDHARRLLRDYQLLAEKMQRQQAEGKQVGDQDAAQLGKLEQELAGNEVIKAWLKAQSDYVDLMYRVDRSIQEGLAEAVGGPAAGQAGVSGRGGPAGQPFIPRVVHPGGGKAEA